MENSDKEISLEAINGTINWKWEYSIKMDQKENIL
jgi:hypothetical protein